MAADAPSVKTRRASGALLLIGLAVLAVACSPWWWPKDRTLWAPPPAQHAEHAAPAADEHAHDHPGHEEANSIELSANALRNIGFQPINVAIGPYQRVVTLPAIVVEQPGHSQVEITAPMTGVVTKIFPVQGGGVDPDSPMFELRLTHEELVVAQRDFLKTAEDLDVVNREIQRLTSIGEQVVAGKRIIEQEYEKQKLEGSLKAERQALLLHGLSESQVAAILQTRELLRSIVVRAPSEVHGEADGSSDHVFHVQQLPVKLGEQVEAGQVLSVLADHCELLIEARAFENDALAMREAAQQGREITARVMDRPEQSRVAGLKLLYLADSIDPETRAFKAYLQLPNEVALDQKDSRGRRFIEWRFKPGQRMELEVPVEVWEDRLILPLETVISEGAEAYVYRQNGDHFDRVPVHIEHRDQTSVVVANDGSLFPGDTVAGTGAYLIHQALKNKAGGGVDPHAGHNH